jgi:hypothetical protein
MAISKPAYYATAPKLPRTNRTNGHHRAAYLRKGDFNLVLCLDETLRTVVDPPQAE